MNTLTRKDIARMVGQSTDVVRRNEERWGLDKCKRELNARNVDYREREAKKALLARGLIEEDEED